MPILEKDIEGAVVLFAKLNGFLCPKVQFAEAGWPDRLFLSPTGHTIFIEFKRPGEKPVPLQTYRIEELRKRGIPAFWCDSTAAGIGILTAALDAARLPAASDKVAPQPSGSSPIPGPGTWKNSDGPRYPQDSEGEGALETGTYSGPVAADVQGMAGRDKEVGRLSDADILGPAWLQKGAEKG